MSDFDPKTIPIEKRNAFISWGVKLSECDVAEVEPTASPAEFKRKLEENRHKEERCVLKRGRPQMR